MPDADLVVAVSSRALDRENQRSTVNAPDGMSPFWS
jgi:hypothetical protein